MRKFLAVMLVLVLILSLTACGGSKKSGMNAQTTTVPTEPAVSYPLYYVLNSMSDEEEVLDASVLAYLDISGYILLEEDSTGRINLYNNEEELDWTKSKLFIDGESYPYTVEEDVLSLSVSDIALTFVLSDETPPDPLPEEIEETEAPVATEAPAAVLTDYWEGQWYGWWQMNNCQGEYADMEGYWWDCGADITALDEDSVKMIWWDEDFTRTDYASEVEFTISGNESASIATSVGGGWFFDATLSDGYWVIDPSQISFENVITIEGHLDGEDGSFDYYILMRPWGINWEDLRADDEDYLPYYYDSWYLPLIEASAGLPDSFPVE